MAYKVLYRKYRPDGFDNLYGQDHIKEILVKSIENDKIAQAYLFSGPRGTGKTSTAKIFAKAINCTSFADGHTCGTCQSCEMGDNSPDIIEIDAASNNGVDEIRNLRESANVLPSMSKYKVYIIDEVHMLSTSAWNAFLKILEEPPKHIVFILATTDVQKVPKTIKSRCQCFKFNSITNDVLEFNIKRVCDLENITIDDDAVKYLSELASGGMRDALSMLDQISKENSKIDVSLIKSVFGQVSTDEIKCLFDSISEANIDRFKEIFLEYENNGLDYNVVLAKIYDYLFDLEIKILNGEKYVHFTLDLIKKIALDLKSANNIRLIKVILISYFNKNINDKVEIAKKEEIIEEKKVEIHDTNVVNEKNDIDKLVDIRINNSFVNVNINEKKKFNELWISYLKEKQLDYDILSLIEGMNVGIVSPTNVTFYHESIMKAKIFNNQVELIENDFNNINNTQYNFICISDEEFNNIKKSYKKDKKYIYINEKDSIINNKALISANEIFGIENVEYE